MTASTVGIDPRRSILAGLIGQGVKPSLTPEMHEREAARQGIRYVYKTIDLPDDRVEGIHLRRLLESAIELGFDGLNITHPIKQAMVPLVDRVTSDVAAIGALNTVLINNGETVGHNTDVTGFGRAFTEGLPGVDLYEVVLLGAGGGGIAVAHALVRLGAPQVHVFDPDDSRARALVKSVEAVHTDVTVSTVSQDRLAGTIASAAGLVNATPVGMAAHPGTPVPPGLLRPDLWVADIVYRPLSTELLREARARGCTILSGAGMAVHQAADAFELITGRPADRDAMTSDFDSMVAAELGATRGTPATHENQSRGRNQK